jgi:hypothetical protein
MKTKLFFIFIALFMGILGCATTKEVVEQPKVEPKQLQAEMPIPFKEGYVKDIENWQDSLLFFNSCKVTISRSLMKERSFIKNGRLYNDDTLINVLKTIEINTTGHIFGPVKRDKGVVVFIPVSFSQRDETYQLSFFREDFIKKGEAKNPGSFVMSGKAELVYEGGKYSVIATIDSKEGDNRLLFFYSKKITSLDVNESAEGWTIPDSDDSNYQNQKENKKEENNYSFPEYIPPK